MNRTIEEWIARYNKKISSGFKRDERFTLFYLPAKGICELRATENMMVIGQVSGDGRFWKKIAEYLAQHLGLRVCGTICERKEILAWIKLFGFKVNKVEEKDSFKRYYCENAKGGWGLVTECIFDKGTRAHHVT